MDTLHVPRDSSQIFLYIRECERKGVCSVTGCGDPADRRTQETVPGMNFEFNLPVPFCHSHYLGYVEKLREVALSGNPTGEAGLS